MMYSKTITIILIGMLCLCIASAQAAEVRIEPEYQTVLKGETFSVNITVYPEGSEQVFGTQYDLYYNNTLLNVTSQTKGSFLSQDGVMTNIYANKFNNTLGKTEYGETRIGDDSGGVTIPGVLTTITFQAIAEENGISELRLDRVKISDPNGNPIPANVTSGNVSVKIGICGDVDGQDGVTIGDGIQVAMSIVYGTDDYPLANPWAADVDCQDGITIGDGIQIAMSIVYGTDDYPLGCC